MIHVRGTPLYLEKHYGMSNGKRLTLGEMSPSIPQKCRLMGLERQTLDSPLIKCLLQIKDIIEAKAGTTQQGVTTLSI